MKINHLLIVVALAFVGVFYYVSKLAAQQEAAIEAYELAEYCEMVKIGKQSDGEYGWPDYKNIYDTECKQ